MNDIADYLNAVIGQATLYPDPEKVQEQRRRTREAVNESTRYQEQKRLARALRNTPLRSDSPAPAQLIGNSDLSNYRTPAVEISTKPRTREGKEDLLLQEDLPTLVQSLRTRM